MFSVEQHPIYFKWVNLIYYIGKIAKLLKKNNTHYSYNHNIKLAQYKTKRKKQTNKQTNKNKNKNKNKTKTKTRNPTLCCPHQSANIPIKCWHFCDQPHQPFHHDLKVISDLKHFMASNQSVFHIERTLTHQYWTHFNRTPTDTFQTCENELKLPDQTSSSQLPDTGNCALNPQYPHTLPYHFVSFQGTFLSWVTLTFVILSTWNHLASRMWSRNTLWS